MNRRWSSLLAAATFVVGLLVGAVTARVDVDQDPTAPASSSAPTPAPTGAESPAPPDAAVAVPRSCLAVADAGERLAALVAEAAVAAAELDADELSDLVRHMEQAQAGLTAQASDCRSRTEPMP